MTVFSSLEAARRAGFAWYEYAQDYELHVVVLDVRRDGKRVRMLAFARPDARPDILSAE